MIRFAFKILFRKFARERSYSLLNIAGLSVGIGVVLIIGLYTLHELSYDRFHSKSDRIYRVAMHLEVGENVVDLNSTFPPTARELEKGVPEVAIAVRLYSLNGLAFRRDELVFNEDDVLYTDDGFFDVFDFDLIEGDPKTCLSKPHQVVLTPMLAQKYFQGSSSKGIVGETILIDGEIYTISGIVREAPSNSHVKFAALASIQSLAVGRDDEWNNMNVSTYVLTEHPVEPAELESKVTQVLTQHLNFERLREVGMVMQPFVQPLMTIHLNSNIQGEFEPNGSITTLYLLTTVALVVLVLASVNFINLVTARAAGRAKEVGVRKVMGSRSGQLMWQFILETLFFVFVSTLLALGWVELLREPFQDLSGKVLPVELLISPPYIFALMVFVVVLGVAAGAYPAFFMASFKPIRALKTKGLGFRNSRLRNFLVTAQFWISIVLIISAFLFRNQLSFMQSMELGFDKDNILILDNADQLPSYDAFVNDLQSLHGIEGYAAALFKPVDDYDGLPLLTEEDRKNRKLVNFSNIDHNYLELLGYEFVAGRNFSVEFASDSNGVILNERAAKYLFSSDEVIGKKVYLFDRPMEVLGVVRDFNFESLRHEVRPAVFFLNPKERLLHVRLLPGNYAEAISSIERLWKRHAPGVPFSYTFLDDDYARLYREEQKLAAFIDVLTALALFIACLGLVGLSAYMAEQRRKEISVRKVLGASVVSLVTLMSRDFGKILMIAFLLAVPVTYFIMRQWLEGFAYQAGLSPIWFVAGGAIVGIAALLIVSVQATRTALANPVDTLRDE